MKKPISEYYPDIKSESKLNSEKLSTINVDSFSISKIFFFLKISILEFLGKKKTSHLI